MQSLALFYVVFDILIVEVFVARTCGFVRMMRGVGVPLACTMFFLVTPAAAQDSESEETRRGSATFLGDTGLWFVPTAEILPHGKVSGSAQRANFDRQEGITDIEHNPATFAVGIADRVELFGSFRVLTRIDRDARPLFDASNPLGGPTLEVPLANDQYSGNKVGDLVLGGKINLLSEANLSPVAFALRGFVKVPTGNEDVGNTTGKPDGAFDVIVSKDLGTVEAAGYGGFAFRGDPDGIDLPNSFRWGVGAGIPIGPTFKLFGEINGEFLTDDTLTLDAPITGPDGSQSALTSPLKNPVDLTLGLQWDGLGGVYVGAGVNVAAIHDNRELAGRVSKTGDRLGLLLRIGFHPGVKVYVPPPPPPPPAPENRPPRVTLTCDPCEIMVGEQSQLRADASDPDGDALEYRWSAPTGEFQGDSNRATRPWQAPDEAGRVPVTVTVDDGRGGSASDTVTIDVTAPPPPPAREYVFEDVHFDFDRYTLRAGASRVLDEVVSAMQDDPNLSLQIDGHTCNIGTAEYNLALGERRANSVEEYLASRGIDGGRLQTISYGEERPQHDNTREETRRLNRRAALVVRLQ